MCVCVYVCQCVFPALSGAGRWRGRIKLPRRASLVPAQARNQRCVCVCAHARVCLCGCCLVIITWLPPTPPPPQLKPVPRPHTLSPGAQSSRSSSASARQTPVAEAPPLLDLEASDAPQAAPLSQMPLTTSAPSAPSSNLSLLDDPTPPTAVVSGEVCLFRPLAAHAIIRRRQRLKQLS